MTSPELNSEVTSELWMTARKLAEMIPGEKTERAWLNHAKRENWPSRKVEGGGRGRGATEYQPSPDVQVLINARQYATPAELAGKPVPGIEKAIEALANPYEYRAREQMAHPYAAPDFALLEVLISFAEGRLTRNVTPVLLDKVDQVVKVWSPVAADRPDLAARLARVKASVDLLRLE